jgi:hypothetical protein
VSPAIDRGMVLMAQRDWIRLETNDGKIKALKRQPIAGES